mmetsp:Transcript_27045/g.23950  ORF Transcript_27045/g.23950 Transcript_27045/m.23950 type:complete len:84 (+) Transcript_27045:488-739(+)
MEKKSENVQEEDKKAVISGEIERGCVQSGQETKLEDLTRHSSIGSKIEELEENGVGENFFIKKDVLECLQNEAFDLKVRVENF